MQGFLAQENAMQGFLARENIARFTAHILWETDPAKLAMLRRLLAEEEAKQAATATEPAPLTDP